MENKALPDEGFVRLPQIIGDKKRGIAGVFPVSRASWYNGIREGIYPAPIKLTAGNGNGNTAGWRVEDIRALIQRFAH